MASNLPLLEEAAAKLKHLLPEVVFVGGSTLDLIVTDQGSAPVRSTNDVDVIIAADYADYSAFCDRLRDVGFDNDTRPGAPLAVSPRRPYARCHVDPKWRARLSNHW